ncbi:hypothetical protein ACWD6R_03885 [Streptomyces sp. NPDC005151]
MRVLVVEDEVRTATGATRWEVRHGCWDGSCPLMHMSFPECAADEGHFYADMGSTASVPLRRVPDCHLVSREARRSRSAHGIDLRLSGSFLAGDGVGLYLPAGDCIDTESRLRLAVRAYVDKPERPPGPVDLLGQQEGFSNAVHLVNSSARC